MQEKGRDFHFQRKQTQYLEYACGCERRRCMSHETSVFEKSTKKRGRPLPSGTVTIRVKMVVSIG
jgi:hypothetical protein